MVTYSFYGKPGIVELLGRFKRLRFRIAWYRVALLLVPFLFILSFTLDALISHTSFKNILLPTSPYFNVAAFIWLMFINSGEEIGWRGFALPRLLHIFKNPHYATLILGILSSAWHLPIYLTPGQSSFPLILFFFFTTGFSFVYTVIFNRTGGSLFSAVLLHASTDIILRILNITFFKPSTWLILGILTCISAFMFVLTFKIGFKPSKQPINTQ